jgi:RNA polymerase sigma-70 factor (ECF subfamily)
MMADPATADDTFLRLVAEYRRPIHRYVTSLVRDASEADDITQETFLRAYRRLASLEDQTKLSAWLYRIATNVCYDRFRQSTSRPRPASLDELSEAPSGGSPAESDRDSPRLDQVMEQKEMSACVQGYLQALSDSYRAVILLHDVEGLSNPEIAEMLGCSLATVKIRLHRARTKLRETLDRACDFSCDDRGVLICGPKRLEADRDPE